MLRIDRPSELLLAAYVAAFAEVVALSLVLSLSDSLGRASLVAGTALLFVAVLALWALVGRPPLPRVQRVALAGPVRALAAVVTIALAYVVALIVGTPPNGWDPLNYHL